MCISLNLPFRMADNEDFRGLVALLRPDAILDLPHRTKLRSLLAAQFSETTARLFADYIPGTKISWAMDVWSSPDMKAFMGINAHFITQSWELREVLAGFEPVHGSHDGLTLGDVFFNVMKSYEGVNLATQTLAITADNASNNDTTRIRLKRRIERQHDGYVWDDKMGSIPCLAHVIQLAVKQLVSGLAIESDNETTLPRFGDDHLPTQENLGAPITFESTLQKVRFSVTL